MRTDASRNSPSSRSGTITGPSPALLELPVGHRQRHPRSSPPAPDQHLPVLPDQLALRPVLPPAQGAELGRKAPVEPGAAAGVLVVDDEVGDAPPSRPPSRAGTATASWR